MKIKLLTAALLASVAAAPVFAQDNTLTGTSASDAEANSGSISGASSDNANANVQNGNVGVSENTNTSTSASGAISGSESGSVSLSDQSQDQGQAQGQSLTSSNQLGQMASNEQGVLVETTFNTTNRKTTEVRTNNAVPLAASSSFSSDYCGGTASVGASVAPIGVSLGGNKPIFDKSCQSLRRAEKFGMAAANYHNMQQPEMALAMMSLMVWSICTSDSDGVSIENPTAQACESLLGSQRQPPQPPQAYVAPQPPVTPEYVAPNADIAPDENWDDEPRTPRGDATATTPGDPLAASTFTNYGNLIATP